MNESLGIFRPIWQVLSKLDLVLLISLIILLTLGGITLHSASGENAVMMQRHFIHLAIATTAMLVTAQLPSHILSQWSIWVYGAGIALLVLVIFQGATGGGAQRWLEFGAFRFQPSEIMKLAVPMMVASYFSNKTLPPKFLHIVFAGVLVIIPMLLIAKQPDLGTALLVGSAGFFVIYFAGIAWKWLIAIFIALAGAAPLLFYFGMEDYQRQRVLTLLD
ncbi:MAG: FtsW/RodA/SpoVE family cell cycle protein, partial [Leucothrix sp.]